MEPPVLEHLAIPKQDLYDGLDDGLYERTFTLPVDGISFSVADLDETSFDELPARIGDAAFEQVIADAGVQLRQGFYKGTAGLPLEVLVRQGRLFVFGFGERSAGRYQLVLEGAWKVA